MNKKSVGKASINKATLGIIIGIIVVVIIVVVFLLIKGENINLNKNPSSLNETTNLSLIGNNTSHLENNTNGDNTGGSSDGDDTQTGDTTTGDENTDSGTSGDTQTDSESLISPECGLKLDYEYSFYGAGAASNDIPDFFDCASLAKYSCFEDGGKIATTADYEWDAEEGCCYWKCSSESSSCSDDDGDLDYVESLYYREMCEDDAGLVEDFCLDEDNIVEYACNDDESGYEYCTIPLFDTCSYATGDEDSVCYKGRCLEGYYNFDGYEYYWVEYPSLDAADDFSLLLHGHFDDFTYQSGTDNDLLGDYTYTKLKIVIGGDVYEIPLNEQHLDINLDTIMKNYDGQTISIAFYTLVEGDLWEMVDSYTGTVYIP